MTRNTLPGFAALVMADASHDTIMQAHFGSPDPGTCDAVQAAAMRRRQGRDAPSSDATAKALHAAYAGDQRAIAAWMDKLTEALAVERQRDTAQDARMAGL